MFTMTWSLIRSTVYTTLVAASTALTATSVFAADLTGHWKTIDDKTGFAKAIVSIQKESDGSYSGTIIKTIPRPDYKPQEFCQKCPEPFTNKPIVGLKVLSGLKLDPDNPLQYLNGRILDPLSGRIYNAKARISESDRRLTMRGYVGFSMLGRSQSWFRDERH